MVRKGLFPHTRQLPRDPCGISHSLLSVILWKETKLLWLYKQQHRLLVNKGKAGIVTCFYLENIFFVNFDFVQKNSI
jgi:hypothetical protein